MKKSWAVFLLLIWASSSFACDCETIPTHEMAFENAEIVFRGRLVDVNTNWMSSGYKVTFEVTESWKKNLEWFATVNVKQLKECNLSFQKEQEYIVYVRKKFSRSTSACFGTIVVSEAGGRLEKLGSGQAPGPSDNLPAMMIYMTLAVFSGLVFVAFIVLRKKFQKNPS